MRLRLAALGLLFALGCATTQPDAGKTKAGFPIFGPTTGGGSSGTVTSVAATAGGLMAVAGTPTVAPTVGLAAASAASIVGATAAGAHADLTGQQALTVIMSGTSTRINVTGAAVTNIDFTGLSGDADGDYEIQGYIKTTTGIVVTFQPENDTANASCQGWFVGASSGAADSSTTKMFVSDDTVGVNTVSFTIYFRAKSGTVRYFRTFVTNHSRALSTIYAGAWTDTSTVLSKIRINSSVASAIDIGSWATIRKLNDQ